MYAFRIMEMLSGKPGQYLNGGIPASDGMPEPKAVFTLEDPDESLVDKTSTELPEQRAESEPNNESATPIVEVTDSPSMRKSDIAFILEGDGPKSSALRSDAKPGQFVPHPTASESGSPFNPPDSADAPGSTISPMAEALIDVKDGGEIAVDELPRSAETGATSTHSKQPENNGRTPVNFQFAERTFLLQDGFGQAETAREFRSGHTRPKQLPISGVPGAQHSLEPGLPNAAVSGDVHRPWTAVDSETAEASTEISGGVAVSRPSIAQGANRIGPENSTPAQRSLFEFVPSETQVPHEHRRESVTVKAEGTAQSNESHTPPLIPAGMTALTTWPMQSTLSRDQETRLWSEDIVGNIADSVTGTAEGEVRSGTAAVARVPVETVAPRHLALQLADAARQLSDGSVELALEPEELGRVRMTMTANDGTMTVLLAVERGETADLMRRHLDILAEEFRSIGFDSVLFAFQDDGADQRDHERERNIHPVPDVNRDDSSGESSIRITVTDGMDLRL